MIINFVYKLTDCPFKIIRLADKLTDWLSFEGGLFDIGCLRCRGWKNPGRRWTVGAKVLKNRQF